MAEPAVCGNGRPQGAQILAFPVDLARLAVGACRASVLATCVASAACGGGDIADDESHVPSPALPDCQSQPEVCR